MVQLGQARQDQNECNGAADMKPSSFSFFSFLFYWKDFFIYIVMITFEPMMSTL